MDDGPLALVSVALAAIILLGVNTCDDPGLVSKPRPLPPGEVISIAPFTGAKLQLVLSVSVDRVFEYQCDEDLVRCGSQPLVQSPGETTIWIWHRGGWSLLVYNATEGEPL